MRRFTADFTESRSILLELPRPVRECRDRTVPGWGFQDVLVRIAGRRLGLR